MGKILEQYEHVKDIIIVIEDFQYHITGRIYKVISGVNSNYKWDTNFIYKLKNQDEPTKPLDLFAETEEEAKIKLLLYMKGFEFAEEIIMNESYF